MTRMPEPRVAAVWFQRGTCIAAVMNALAHERAMPSYERGDQPLTRYVRASLLMHKHGPVVMLALAALCDRNGAQRTTKAPQLVTVGDLLPFVGLGKGTIAAALLALHRAGYLDRQRAAFAGGYGYRLSSNLTAYRQEGHSDDCGHCLSGIQHTNVEHDAAVAATLRHAPAS